MLNLVGSVSQPINPPSPSLNDKTPAEKSLAQPAKDRTH